MKLIVGLGNPGDKYLKTRHNLGFMVLDDWVKKINAGEWQMEEKFNSEVLKFDHNSDQIILIKPQTFMNSSGMSVAGVANYFKVSPDDVVVIHDDLDLVLGRIKVRQGGAAAGHHGVESIIDALGTDQFIRVRLGIGNERSHSGEHKRVTFNAEHFVLESFMPDEHSKLKHLIKQTVQALELLLEKGLEEAQNQHN